MKWKYKPNKGNKIYPLFYTQPSFGLYLPSRSYLCGADVIRCSYKEVRKQKQTKKLNKKQKTKKKTKYHNNNNNNNKTRKTFISSSLHWKPLPVLIPEKGFPLQSVVLAASIVDFTLSRDGILFYSAYNAQIWF